MDASALYPNHYFLSARCKGKCTELLGRTLFCFVFVSHPGETWLPDEISSVKREALATLRDFDVEAKREGVSLTCLSQFITLSAPLPTQRSDTYGWLDLFAKQQRFGTPEKMHDSLIRQQGASQAAFVFFSHTTGRSYASSSKSSMHEVEYSVVYRNSNGLKHELLHIFGARDYYYPNEVVIAAKQCFHSSVMLDCSPDAPIDNLTRYIIGWKKKLTPDARAFLDATRHMTPASIGNDWTIPDTDWTVRIRDDHTYIGAYKNGSKTGRGTYVSYDGYLYSGNYVVGKCSGHGVEVYSNGASYTGEQKDGKRSGKGTYVYPDGSIYSGDWVNNVRQGQGIWIFPDGSIYTGSFANGYCNGIGTCYNSNGDKYTGEWANDKFSGTGTYTWADGDYYTGGFLDGVRHGYGVQYSAGKAYSQQWDHGKRLE